MAVMAVALRRESERACRSQQQVSLLESRIADIPGVLAVHELHIWRFTQASSCRVDRRAAVEASVCSALSTTTLEGVL